ncbi:MAG: hypothetical protein JWQ81_7501 [Amycolatopsis sp.]|uniref:hypothetical protein n=1 Tax=Amycolatopsis sp. TaxID=37632 RepID=UPI00262E21B8|nr:hypothetical protein [Amycolatopsis sp.]MCU1686762.1 hypothetical protein [Amycolatopsis sp.]
MSKAADVQLQVPQDGFAVRGMRIMGGYIILKRADPGALFELYTMEGAFTTRVPADVEQVTLTGPSGPWFAGETVTLTVDHTAEALWSPPKLRVWLRPLGVPEFTELASQIDRALSSVIAELKDVMSY